MPYTIAAVPNVSAGAVNVTVQGGVPGTPLYIFRRDSAGVGVVRDTSLATVLWPAYASQRTQLVKNPNSATTPISGVNYGTGGIGSIVLTAGAGEAGSYGAVMTWTTAGTAGGGTTSLGGDGSADNINVVAGTTITASIAMKVNQARTIPQGGIAARVDFYTAAGAAVGSAVIGTAVAATAGQEQRVAVTTVVPATATRARVSGIAPNLAGTTNGYTQTVSRPLVEVAAAAGTYFDGSFVDTAALDYAWTGTANASTSVESTTAAITVVDNEARQGESNVDYLLADGNGVMLASVRVALPLWGTWLKSPARPFLNTRCYLEREGPVKRPARREVVTIEGSSAPIVLSQQRAGKSGTVRLVALTAATDAALTRLLDQGDTLMIDTDPAWRLAYRYVNVGDVSIERSYWDDQGLTIAARTYELADLVGVEAPIGVTAVAPGRTYSMLPTLYGSYAAMAATVPTYESLATGI